MKIDAASRPYHPVQLFEVTPLGLVPPGVRRELHRRPRHHGAPSERRQAVATLAPLEVLDVSERAQQKLEPGRIEAQSARQIGRRPRAVAQRFEHAESHAGHEDASLQWPEHQVHNGDGNQSQPQGDAFEKGLGEDADVHFTSIGYGPQCPVALRQITSMRATIS